VAEQELRQYEAASRQLREALIGEAPAHWVTITRPFYMATCEVTQEQYAQVMNANPSLFKGPKLPVETVTWHDAQAFCVTVTLSTDYELRLPTEAEWEYACRGGPVGHEVSAAELAQYAWHKDTSGGRTQSAGQLKPNALELHDMLGNIWEWCQDTVADYSTAEQTDPLQTERPGGYEMRAIRGGSWYNDAACSRSAKRAGAVPDMKLEYIGFRVVMETAANMQ
jgi:formylglycine-generating enzyme required for sulfatase activity